ncbi:MAG: T9SS type A sorting domain-containing protein, partial [Saprospiraceae bacterium]|nr:T9SS type A sorting domain-containing protein [Saprospiraceae bacterium]
ISRQLISYDGTITTTSPFNIYSVVNRNTSGVQGISSVAGRFSSITSGEQKLVTFFNEDNSEVNYKIISFSSTQFRVKQPEIQADVYPNPTSNIVNIKIDTEFETAKLELYNLQGQRLIQKEINEQKFALDVSELNPGIYKLRVSTENSSDTKNISIIR